MALCPCSKDARSFLSARDPLAPSGSGLGLVIPSYLISYRAKRNSGSGRTKMNKDEETFREHDKIICECGDFYCDKVNRSVGPSILTEFNL